MKIKKRHFIVNDISGEFHINPAGTVPALTQYAKGDCQVAEIKEASYVNDFVELVELGRKPCAHCIGRLARVSQVAVPDDDSRFM